MKKNGFISFLALGLYALGAIGGLGWSLYNQSYVVAAGIELNGADRSLATDAGLASGPNTLTVTNSL